MKTKRPRSSARLAPPSGELDGLRARLAEAEETLRAVRSGEVDTVVVAGAKGDQVFTLRGAEHAYRMLIESMNEGALTLTPDMTILYANRCFARMVRCRLEDLVGGSLRRFFAARDLATLRPLLLRPAKAGSKTQVLLTAGDGSLIPAQISIRPLAKNGSGHATIGMVLTDMSEARRNEQMLRALTHRVVQVQEAERARVALELHDNITQLLCGVLFLSEALTVSLLTAGSSVKKEATKLHELIAKTADEVERISRNLRPGVLDQLDLVAVLRDTCTKFAERTGIAVKLARVLFAARLPAETELALYRILQQAFANVEKHAHAHHVAVALKRRDAFIQLTIKDDGVGFNPERDPAREGDEGGLDLLGMRERAAYVGGTLVVKSARRRGTEIEVRVPLPLLATTDVPRSG